MRPPLGPSSVPSTPRTPHHSTITIHISCPPPPGTRAQVALVDAFGIEDYALNSALGRQDGDVYAALLEMAQVWACSAPLRLH